MNKWMNDTGWLKQDKADYFQIIQAVVNHPRPVALHYVSSTLNVHHSTVLYKNVSYQYRQVKEWKIKWKIKLVGGAGGKMVISIK